MLNLLRSPLDRIDDLETVPPEKVQELEDYLRRIYLEKVAQQIREARPLAEALRAKPLY
jgi:hypothetical protein